MLWRPVVRHYYGMWPKYFLQQIPISCSAVFIVTPQCFGPLDLRGEARSRHPSFNRPQAPLEPYILSI
jgi:hypothetical protein